MLDKHPDWEQIESLLPALAVMMVARLQAKGLPVDAVWATRALYKAVRGEASAPFNIVACGPCLVAYNSYHPWWSEHTLLIEEFIVRYKPGPFEDTLAGLDVLASREGCDMIAVGTLAMDREESYSKLLTRNGYKRVAYQLVKEL